MKVAVVLAGGGALGAYQVGVMDAISSMEKYVSWYTGVSVGALNAGLAAQYGMAGVHPIWSNLRASDVYKKYSKLRSAYRIITKGGSRSSAPLKNLIRKYIKPGAGKLSFAGMSNMSTGEYRTVSSHHLTYREALLASASIPLIVPPVVINGDPYYDGGVLNMTPLGHALSLEPDALIIITTRPYPNKAKDELKGLKGIGLVKKTIGMLVNEGYESDIREFLFRNDHPEYKRYEHVMISPSELLGDSDDFSLYNERFSRGRRDGLLHFDKIAQMIGGTNV